MKRGIVFISALIYILNSHSFAQTTIPGGDVSGTWESVNSPYIIDGDITIPDDSTLTIQPGVIVEFQGHFSLTVLGRLLAMGTEKDSILFTVNDTTGFSDPDTSLGGWYGIRFIDTPVSNDTSKIIHCCMEYSKAFGTVWHLNSGGAICILQFGKVVISDCLIRNNSAVSPTEHPSIGGGLYFYESDIIVRNNTFINNRAHSGGAIFFDESDPVFLDNHIENNFAVHGGGISMGGECYPTFTNDRIVNNEAEYYGGGLLFSEPSVVKCGNITVEGNTAVWGGGIGIKGGELHADDCLFMENHAELWGGGVAGDFATMDLSGCTFEGNTSDWGSGGLHMDHAVVDVSHCSFTENRAVFGGGFHALFSQVISQDNVFLDNQTEGGGGIHVENSDCIVDQSHFQGNQALNGSGGAIDCSADTTIFGRSYQITVSRSRIIENSAFTNSGAVRIEQANSEISLIDVVVDSCQFERNHADVYGSLRLGGYMKDFRVSNCLFSSNTSSRYVGGAGLISNSTGMVYNCVFNANYSGFSDSTKTAHGASLGGEAEVVFVNCTFVDTSSADGVGLSVRRGSRADVINSIFWRCGNRPIAVNTAAGLGSTVHVNYCNIEYGIDSINVSDSLSLLDWGTGNLAADPLFADLPNTNLHLTESSPCIGAGVDSILLNEELVTTPVRDMENNPRPLPQDSNPDMGAFEHELGAPASTGYFQTRIPAENIICRIYPNPFGESATFHYQLSVSCHVELSIYNIYGQKVATLVSGDQSSGVHQVAWDGSELSGGQFFYRLVTDKGIVQTGKLLMLK